MQKIEVKKYDALEHIFSRGALRIGLIIFVLLGMVYLIVKEWAKACI